jgi:hypothetical protein
MSAYTLEVIRRGAKVAQEQLAAIATRHANIVVRPIALHRFAAQQ